MLKICRRTQLLNKNSNFLEFKMAAAAILNFESRLPNLHYSSNHHPIWWKCWKSDFEFNCYLKMQITSNSRWRPPPSWISKISCHFFTIEPILTKFDENVENLTLNVTVASKMHIYVIQDDGARHLEFQKSVVISLLVNRSAPNSVGMLRIWP